MHWENKVKFFGQVKLVGVENSMNWKTGTVHFEYDAVSGAWMVKLYLKVNPSKVYQQMRIGQSDVLDVKCGRLRIENKKGDGIHIKLSDNDSANAKLVVSKIKKSAVNVLAANKAEVGLTSNAVHSSHKGSENVSPLMKEDFKDLSLLNGEKSPERRSGGWLSKNTPPMKSKECNPPKRRLELFSPEKARRDRVIREEDKKNERQVYSSQNFTGMKDYSKRNLHGGNNFSATNGLGTKNFYGPHNNTNTVYGNTHTNTSSRSLDRSPSLKRQKLSASVFLSNQSNRMEDSRVPESTSSSPISVGSNSSTRSLDGSFYDAEAPRRHLRAGEIIGFQNLGNTCFLNSPLQCLSSLEPLCLDLQSAIAEYGTELTPVSMTRMLYLLMKDVRQLDACPERVKEILIRLRSDMNTKFAPDTQQDAHELLSELLNRVDEEVKAARQHRASSKGLPAEGADTVAMNQGAQASALSGPEDGSASIYTPTEANFCWSYRTCMYFHECKTEVICSQTQHEMTLMLPLDSSTRSLQDCINKYFASTEVEMTCQKCGRVEKTTITRKIVRRPRVFILNLLRYRSDSVESTKKADHISVPNYISVCEFSADDVKRSPPADPIFMLDREELLNLKWADNVNKCRCSRDAISPSRTGFGTAITPRDATPPSRTGFGTAITPRDATPPSRTGFGTAITPRDATPPSRTGFGTAVSSVMNVQDYQGNPATEIDHLDAMVSELQGNLEQYASDCAPTNMLYNTLSQPTVTTPTPNRALMLLNMDTHVSPENLLNSDSETVLDFSQNSFGTSPLHTKVMICGSMPSHTGRNSLIRTSKDPFLFQSPIKGAAASVIQRQEESDSASFLTPTNDHQKKVAVVKGFRRPILKGTQSGSFMRDPEALLVLTNYVSFNLRFVDQYVEEAREMGNNISALYDGAQKVMSELLNTPTIVSTELLKRILDADNQLGLSKDTLEQVSESLITTRYDHSVREKNIEHLREDLAMCISASQCGILPSHQNQTLTTKTLENQIPGNGRLAPRFQTELRNQNKNSDAKTKTQSDNSHLDDDVEVTFKKSVSFKNNLNENYNKNINLDGVNLSVGRSVSREISPLSVSVENIWKDEHWKEENIINTKKDSSEDSSSRTRYVYSLDSNRQLLQGKDISLYTEFDLQEIDCDSLTEDEMMIYAQALSRFAYEKEQATHMENTSPDTDVAMDVCNFTHNPENVRRETSNNMTYLKAAPAKYISLKEEYSSSTDLDVEVTSGSSNGADLLKMHKAGIITSRSAPAVVSTSLGTSESHQSELASLEPSLFCQENLNDQDEADHSGYHFESGFKVLTAASLTHALEAFSASHLDDLAVSKNCISCGRLCLGECTLCGSLDQADFDSHPLDVNLSILQDNALFYDIQTPEKIEVSHFQKSNISQKDNSEERSELSFVENAKSTNISPSLHSPAVKSAQKSSDSDDHLVPRSPYSGPKKEYLYSLSKTNNLVKTRDYARLRSPSVSPKKRAAKGQQSDDGSVPKRLHFIKDDKIGKIHKLSPDEDSFSGEDCNSSDLHNASLEVNIDDASFLVENTHAGSFLEPSAWNVSHHSTPKPSTTMLVSAASKWKTSSVNKPDSSGIASSTSPTSLPAEEHSFQLLQPQTIQQSHMQTDQLDSSLHRTRAINIASKNTQENIQPESLLGTKLKTSRQSLSSVSGTEEKENMYTDLEGATCLQNTELEKSDLSYKLVGVVDHTGSSQFTGHYTAYAFNMKRQKWFYLNDSETQMVTEEEVRENNTETGYLFFYMDKELFNKYSDKVTTHL